MGPTASGIMQRRCDPSLNILEPELIGRIVDEAKRVLAEHGFEIRGREMRRRLIDAGLPQRDDGRILFPRDDRRGGDPDRAVVVPCCSTAAAQPRADIGDDRVHFIPGSSGLKVLDHRTGEARQAMSLDFAEYIRLGDGLANIPYLATAFSTARHRAAGVRRVAPLPVPDELDEAGRVGRVHRARRAPDGRDDGACSATAPTTCAPARCRSSRSPRPATSATSEDSCQNLIDCVEAGHPGRDRAGHADGPDRAGDARSARRSSTRSTSSPGSRWPR